MSNWYKKAKIVDDVEISNLLARLPLGDQMELFKNPLWDSYSKSQQMSMINRKLDIS
jgi:hypothetical protein